MHHWLRVDGRPWLCEWHLSNLEWH